MQLFPIIEQRYPRLRNDDLEAHLKAYAEITQDDRADAIARTIVMVRENMYYQWQAQMAAAMAPADGPTPNVGGGPRKKLGPSTVAREGAGTGGMPTETQ